MIQARGMGYCTRRLGSNSRFSTVECQSAVGVPAQCRFTDLAAVIVLHTSTTKVKYALLLQSSTEVMLFILNIEHGKLKLTT